MKIHCLYDKLVPIKELISHPHNSNSHPPEQVTRLAKILDLNGWRYPVKVSKLSGFVTSGHGRIMAAKENRWDSVPVNFQDYENDALEFADVTADNAIAQWAELDLSMIDRSLPEFGPELDIELLGLRDFALNLSDKETVGAKELSMQDFESFNHKCPRCGFKFDTSKKDESTEENNGALEP